MVKDGIYRIQYFHKKELYCEIIGLYIEESGTQYKFKVAKEIFNWPQDILNMEKDFKKSKNGSDGYIVKLLGTINTNPEYFL